MRLFDPARTPPDTHPGRETGWDSQRGRMVDMNSVISTGYVSLVDRLSLRNLLRDENMTVDLQANDSYAVAVRNSTASTIQRLQNSATYRELMDKPEWNRADRIRWERELAITASQALASNAPRLDTYRTRPGSDVNYGLEGVRREGSLNALANDIDHPSAPLRVEYDCEHASITLGLIMQEAENQLLRHAQAGRAPALHQAHPYILTSGINVDQDGKPSSQGTSWHAFMLSSATGNMIDATSGLSRRAYGSQFFEELRQNGREMTGSTDRFRGANFSDINNFYADTSNNFRRILGEGSFYAGEGHGRYQGYATTAEDIQRRLQRETNEWQRERDERNRAEGITPADKSPSAYLSVPKSGMSFPSP